MNEGSLNISRRQMLQGTAALGLGLAVSPSVAAAAAGSPLTAASGEPVFFRGWQFQTDIVQSNVDRYNKELSGKVDYATVTGDYPALMQKDLIAKANLDVFYGNPSQAVRYLEAGWLTPVNELPDYETIAASIYPNILDAWTHKGKLMGLCYFAAARGVMAVHLEKYLATGLSEAQFPKNWAEFYATLQTIRAKEKQPYLPSWYNEWHGMPWSFAFEVMNRGGTIADAATHQPMMSVDTQAGDTLRDWKRIWKDKLVPEEVIGYNEASFLDAFRSGRYVFSPQDHYYIADFNKPDRSPQTAGKITFLPYQGQPWGMLLTAMYLMSSRSRSPAATDDVKRFATWYGYKDQNGDPFVGKRWLKENLLFSAYKEVMERPETADITRKALARPEDYEKLIKIYQNVSYAKGVWNVVWAEEYNTWIKDKLFSFLLDDLDEKDVIKDANDRIASLNEKYKIK